MGFEKLNDIYFHIKDSNTGKEMKCEILGKYHEESEDTYYIVYTDYLFDIDGTYHVYYSELYLDEYQNICIKNIDDSNILEELKEVFKGGSDYYDLWKA